MNRIKTLIVDDESPAREGIAALLKRDADTEIIGSCSNGMEALQVIQEKAPDLLFLDIQMPGMDGFQLLSKIDPSRMPVVIFVTAYDEYALQAFQVHGLDYLLKSYSDERFNQALTHAKKVIRERQTAQITDSLMAMIAGHGTNPNPDPMRGPKGNEHNTLSRLVVKEGGRVFFLSVDEIDWIESADYYVCLHIGDRSHLIRESLTGLEKKLDPARFQRIHRSTIVNLDRVRELQPYQHGDYMVILHSGVQLKLSRSYRSNLEAALGSSI